LIWLKAKAKTILNSEQGIANKNNVVDMLCCFGNRKHNMNFKRFIYRRIDKANAELR
jgi:hypothetical protein